MSISVRLNKVNCLHANTLNYDGDCGNLLPTKHQHVCEHVSLLNQVFTSQRPCAYPALGGLAWLQTGLVIFLSESKTGWLRSVSLVIKKYHAGAVNSSLSTKWKKEKSFIKSLFVKVWGAFNDPVT